MHGSVTLPAAELEQIQFLLGHVSVQTTKRYLGCKQELREAVNDQMVSNQYREAKAAGLCPARQFPRYRLQIKLSLDS